MREGVLRKDNEKYLHYTARVGFVLIGFLLYIMLNAHSLYKYHEIQITWLK